MSELVMMPKLGFDMASGTLVNWVKDIGDAVNKGDILVEVETDKATVEVEAFASGILKGIFAEEGAIVLVGALIGVIASEDEQVDLDALQKQANQLLDADEYQPSSEATEIKEELAVPATETGSDQDSFLRISPVAQRMAAEHGIDVRKLQGSGRLGRIVKRDIEKYLATTSEEVVPAKVAQTKVDAVDKEDSIVNLSNLRLTIGRRMTASKQNLPHFYVTNEIEMSEAMKLRQQLNQVLEEKNIKISVNDFVVKAAAVALREFPNLNAVMDGDQLIRKGHINVGVAVSVDGGLLTIVIQDADIKSLARIADESQAMAKRVREGKVQADDIQGSTFTTSNLGMFDVEHFVAIINPPEVAILATGSAKQVPVVSENELTIGTRMKATISADHRATDGAEAARFMQVFKRNLEEPMRLVL
jgi:pyruvate dehydrogenase E2 component (dihydrolipoamide acetyltransferase)